MNDDEWYSRMLLLKTVAPPSPCRVAITFMRMSADNAAEQTFEKRFSLVPSVACW